MVEGQEGVTWEQWRALACAAEGVGLEALFRSDHYFSILRGGAAGSLDAWALLSALAAVTDQIRLGTMVSPVTFRPASVLAKNAVTVDHVSGGRVELGMGAGWYEAEHDVYGFSFPTERARFDELDRQLEEIRRQWEPGSEMWPKPVQEPLPIIVGGKARPRSVAAAVRWANEYNTTSGSVDEIGARRRTIDEAARKAGREPLAFSMMCGCVVGRDRAEAAGRLAHWRELTSQPDGEPPLYGTLDEVAERLRVYERAGVERVMLQHLAHEDLETVAIFGDLVGAVAA
jgi:alkanesulfonate monooxygenase SsuD/methylene tetrahydromethanopterin reductase-like flavin-dependent oxidoreductase (luciferase family)